MVFVIISYPNSIQCRYCEYYAPYGLSLQQHEVLHNDYTPSERGFKSEKEKKKFCPECPYKAVKNREIKCHQLNHVYREGYLKCRYCNYYLINTKGMKQHEVLHATDKSYTVNAYMLHVKNLFYIHILFTQKGVCIIFE